MAIPDFTAITEDGNGLVEEEAGSSILSSVEKAAQVFLGLSDVFADHRREVDAIEIKIQGVGDDFGCHCLPSAALAYKQGVDPQATVYLGGKSPVFIDFTTLPYLVRELVEHARLLTRQHKIIPGHPGIQPLSQGIQAWTNGALAGLPEATRKGALIVYCRVKHGLNDALNGRQIEVELACQQSRAVGCSIT